MAISGLRKLLKLTIATKANRGSKTTRDLLNARVAGPASDTQQMKAAVGKANTVVKKLDADTAKRTGFTAVGRIQARLADVQPTTSTKARIERAKFRTEVKAERAQRLSGTAAISRVKGRTGTQAPAPNFVTGKIQPDKKVPTLKRRIKTGRR